MWEQSCYNDCFSNITITLDTRRDHWNMVTPAIYQCILAFIEYIPATDDLFIPYHIAKMHIVRVRHGKRLEPKCFRMIISSLLHWRHNEHGGGPNHRPAQMASNAENVSILWRHHWYHWPYCESSDARRNDQWNGALMFSLLLARTLFWPYSRVFGDLRHHVTVCNGTGLLKK